MTKEYPKYQRLGANEDPFSLVHDLDTTYLVCLSTSVATERLFSEADLIYDENEANSLRNLWF